jgi:hypothetical protein
MARPGSDECRLPERAEGAFDAANLLAVRAKPLTSKNPQKKYLRFFEKKSDFDTEFLLSNGDANPVVRRILAADFEIAARDSRMQVRLIRQARIRQYVGNPRVC